MTSSVETDIRTLLDEHAAAYAARDADQIMAAYVGGAVRYSLAPPLQQAAGTTVGDVPGVQKWLATFDGPVQLEYQDPVVTADGDVAFVHALTQMTATPAAEPFSF